MYHSLFEGLCMVPDPRIDRKKVYPLDFLLLMSPLRNGLK